MDLLLPKIERRRRAVGRRFLAGRGVEIGALHLPMSVSDGTIIKRVDRMTVEDLRWLYPELSNYQFAAIDVIDDGERLDAFADEALDFVVANHMLEHCENLLGALRSHLSKVKLGGHLYYAVPDKRFTFDVNRPMTTFEHLLRDDAEGSAWSHREHFLEWARLVDKAPDEDAAEKRAQHLMKIDYSIHFHVWDRERFSEILARAHEYLGRGFQVVWFEPNGAEIICVLRKVAPLSPGGPLFAVETRSLTTRVRMAVRRLLNSRRAAEHPG